MAETNVCSTLTPHRSDRNNVRLNFREFFASLPITGRFVKSELIPIPTVYAWVVRHRRLGLYWRDPYQRLTNAGDPRSDWGRYEQAYKFVSEHQASCLIAEYQIPGELVRLVIREGNC